MPLPLPERLNAVMDVVELEFDDVIVAFGFALLPLPLPEPRDAVMDVGLGFDRVAIRFGFMLVPPLLPEPLGVVIDVARLGFDRVMVGFGFALLTATTAAGHASIVISVRRYRHVESSL